MLRPRLSIFLNLSLSLSLPPTLSSPFSFSLSFSPLPSSMWQLPQRNFVPFAVTMQCGDVAGAMTGAGAGAGAEAGAGDMAGAVAIAGDEAIAIAVAEGRGVYCCHAPRALCCMTAKIYVCIYIYGISVCAPV